MELQVHNTEMQISANENVNLIAIDHKDKEIITTMN